MTTKIPPTRIAQRFLTALVAFLCMHASASAQTIANVGLTQGWATFGLAVPRGTAQGLKVGTLDTQVDVKNRWPDGTIKFAIVTVNSPAGATYPVVPAAPSLPSGFSPSWPSVVVQMTVRPSGARYTATLPSTPNLTDSWLSGGLVREARVRVVPTGASGDHPFLRVLFDVRAFNNGSSRIDVIGENTLVQNSTTDRVDYDLDISINGSSVYSRASLTESGTLTSSDRYLVASSAAHGLSKGEMIELLSGPQAGEVRMVGSVYDATRFTVSWPLSAAQSGVSWRRLAVRHWAGSRWRKTFGVGNFQEAQQIPDFTPFYAANAIPPFLSSVSSDATFVGRGPSPYEPMNVGVVTIPGNSAGGRPEIGPYPQWTARYVVHRTSDLRAVVLGEGSSSGTFPIHWADDDNRPLISLDDHPTFWRSWGNHLKGMGMSDDGTVDHFQMDSPHVPSLAFVPYLITGDRYYLDEMRYWANWSMLSTYTQGPTAGLASRGDATGYLGQVFNAARGFGWALRNLTDVAVWAPDSDPYKAYFETRLVSNLRIGDAYAASRTQSPWGAIFDSFDGYNPSWPEGTSSYPVYIASSPWMTSYLGWAVDHAMQQGYTDGGVLRGKIATLMMNIYNSPAVAPGERAPYRLFSGVIPTAGAPVNWFPTLDAAYTAMRVDGPAVTIIPPELGAYYGTDVRLIYQIASRLGMSGGAEAIRWIEGYTDPHGTPFMQDLNERSQYAVATTADYVPAPPLPAGPVSSPPPPTTTPPPTESSIYPPTAPANVRVVR